VVQAFASGSEGTVNLLLTGLSETFLEICNNGIDDGRRRGHGLLRHQVRGRSDCVSIWSASQPRCWVSCRLMAHPRLPRFRHRFPLPTKPRALVCRARAAARPRSVFTLTAKADLTIEWSQFGNHDLVLYHQINAHLPCEANTQLDCHTTADAATGSYSLPPGLAQGDLLSGGGCRQAGQRGRRDFTDKRVPLAVVSPTAGKPVYLVVRIGQLGTSLSSGASWKRLTGRLLAALRAPLPVHAHQAGLAILIKPRTKHQPYQPRL